MKRSAYSFQPQLKVDCYHLAEAPRLFVRRVSLHDLLNRWVPYHPKEKLPEDDAYYIDCQRHGLIDWKTAKVYTSEKLVGRNNVSVIRLQR